MPPEILEFVGPLLGMLAFGTFTLTGFKMWLSYKTARLGSGGGEDVKRLQEVVETLHEQMLALREEHAELHDRLDFAERLLTKQQHEALPGDRQ